MFGDVREVDLVWHYLVFDREIKSKRKPHDLLELKSGIVQLIDTIERAEEENDFEAEESGLCGWWRVPVLMPETDAPCKDRPDAA